MRRFQKILKRRAALALLLSLVLPVFLMSFTVFAETGVNFDDYVSEGASDGDSAGMDQTVVDQSNNEAVSQNSADAENNDGDDTYINNNGITFQIPRVSDNSKRVYDFAGLMTDEQVRDLEDRIARLEEKKGADIVILTSNDVPLDAYYSTDTSMRYARQFLLDNGFQDDSFICIVDMNNRVFWAVGYGKYGTQKYSGWGTKVYDKVKNRLSSKDYWVAMKMYLDQIERLDNPLMAAIPTALSLVISAIATLVVLLGFNIRHSSTQPSKANTPPVKVQNYRSLHHDKHYLGTTVHRRHIPRSSGGGHSGGGGFSGGGFSSGSGGSFSGGGGHF